MMIMATKEFVWHLNAQEIDWARKRLENFDSSEVMASKRYYNVPTKSFLDKRIDNEKKKRNVVVVKKDVTATESEVKNLREVE